MKLIMILLVLSTNAFASYEGTLQLDSPIDYKRFFCQKTALPGDYLIKVSKSSRSIKLKFKDIEGAKHKIKIKVPKHALPEHGGSVTLLPGQTGQEFGIQANLNSRQVRRQEQTRRESCTIKVRVRRCHTDDNGRRRCQTRYEDRPGTQYVRYMVTTYQKDLSLNLLDQEMMTFATSQTREMTSTSNVIYRGSCQRNP